MPPQTLPANAMQGQGAAALTHCTRSCTLCQGSLTHNSAARTVHLLAEKVTHVLRGIIISPSEAIPATQGLSDMA